ncbi:MAG: RNA 2',3'-cyclic phosphodiesterase [Syntrophomonadaceae bacterium]|jgi:2'-5' RNA ligase|nr:RNA 2',3'-cyclic phosphodiesterase [Syntrophomonadaceae bacterium]MDH7498695.1 RNA 2',3'-cyclic phosphodiesterase [Syntrophomonadaceae bacterium]
MRLFVAVAVPPAVVERAEQVKGRLMGCGADVKWVWRENYHLTVKFLGEVEEARVAAVVQELRAAAGESPPFVLRLLGAGAFPSLQRPRVLWLGVGGDVEKAEWLGERVDARLAELGFEPERQRSLHLTLGRMRTSAGVQGMLRLLREEGQAGPEPEFEVREVLLMESRLSREGPSYRVVAVLPLLG